MDAACVKLNAPLARARAAHRRCSGGVFSAQRSRLRRCPRLRHAAGEGPDGPSSFRLDAPAIATDRTAISQFAAAELKAGERVAGRYRIEALLGVGGMGVVYRAHDEELGIDVALKLLRPELAAKPEAFERFRQELLLARQVGSKHVVRIHDLVADGERRLISMDYVPGRSLEQHLDQRGALPLDEALAIARQIALGLSAAHASGIVHRDLKPANVLLRDDGHACISDFGVARSAAATRVTGTGLMVGTPDYVSPEQARGDAVGPRSDLYALGLILYEMLAGRRPFHDATPSEALAQRQLRAPPRLRKLRPELPAWLERLVARLLEPNPLRRLRDADAVVAAIDAQRVARARPRAGALAAAAALALAAAGGAWWVNERGLSLSVQSADAATAPLDLALLPLQAAPADRDLADAYSALIGASLLAGEAAVADRRRINNALTRLGFDADTAAQYPQRVLVEVGARRLLSGSLQRSGDRVRVVLRLDTANAPEKARTAATAEVGGDALAPALRAALAQLDLSDAYSALGTVWPANEAALRAFGRGLGAGRSEAALAAYAEALRLEPRFVAAWWQRLQLARRLLSQSAQLTLAAGAREALRAVRGRDAERVQALIALIEGNPQLAAERFAPLVAADPHDHHTRLLHVEALDAAGQGEAAERELVQLTELDPQNADAWLLRGQRAIRAGEAQRAVDDYLLRARVLYTRLRDEHGRADALNALGLGFDLLGQTTTAIDYFTQAAELRERLGNRRGASGSRRNLAWAYATAGDFAAADVQIARARTLIAGIDDPELQAGLLNDAGLIAEERGDFAAALPYFREVLALREAQSDLRGVNEAAANLGFALLHMGAFDDAQTYLLQAERNARAADDRVGIVRSLQLLATLDIARGAYADADRRLQTALRMAEETNLAEERAVLHAERAELERQRGAFDAAIAQGTRALALFEELGDARGRAEALLDLAAAHRDAGRIAEMARTLQRFDDAPPAGREHRALLAVRRGELALARGDAADAMAQAERAIADAEAAHSPPAVAQARLLRTRALAARGDAAAARAELARADDVLSKYPAAALRRQREAAADGLDAETPSPAVRVAEREGPAR